MANKATITFAQTGVQPPVYVVTSLSSPPWETLEMSVEEEQTASANLVFTKHFDRVAEGSYQYKIRIGEGYWVVDESHESATDDHGNRNNVIHVQPASHINLAPSESDAPVHSGPPKSPDVPLVVVEKTDDKPAYGDDFGEGATTAQKVAHDMRAADASPDELIISPEPHVEPGTEDGQATPLLRHETSQANDPPPVPSMDISEDESVQSSTDQTSSSEVINTPSEQDESPIDDELAQGPLLTHETGFGDEIGEPENGPLLSHETRLAEENVDHAPLLSLHDDPGVASDDEDEFDRFPLLSHETGFSDSKSHEIVSNSDVLEHEEEIEPQHYGPYGDEDEERFEDRTSEDDYEGDMDRANGFDDSTPLLPHERDSAIASNTGSELSTDDADYMLQGRPTFAYENENEDAKDSFGGSGRPNIFRTRTNSSTLPHKLPRSDAEDENLDDPSLERFPTSREQILERVATIGLHLPEDETIENTPHSPQPSVLSQACSSIDLVPVKSYTSLASVPEADDSDEEDDDDVDSLPSPMLIGAAHSSSRFASDTHTAPMHDDSKRLGLNQERAQASSARTVESSEAETINTSDGAEDSSSILSTLREAIATPTKVLDPITPPLTPEKKTKTVDQANAAPAPESQLRQRRDLKDDSAQTAQSPIAASSQDIEDANAKDKITRATSPATAQQPNKQDGTFLQHFIRTVFGSVGRFLATCIGDRKRASTTALVVGVAFAAYYLVSWAS